MEGSGGLKGPLSSLRLKWSSFGAEVREAGLHLLSGDLNSELRDGTGAGGGGGGGGAPGVKLALPRGLDDCLEHTDKCLVDSMEEMGNQSIHTGYRYQPFARTTA